MAVGAVLPVLPRYVRGPLASGDIAVGVVVGSYALTGLAGRPLAGRLADRRGRKPIVVLGTLLTALAGLLYLLPTGLPGLIGARLVLGLGEGSVFTAGSAWIVDLAPPGRRGRVIGLYGLAVWSGLSVGPSIGELLYHAAGFHLVWAFAAAVESLGLALIALATNLPMAIVGSAAMGTAFSLLYPSLSLVVVNQVPEGRRGAALGTFTGFFDLGVGLGAPLAGIAATLGGYPAAFWLASACALGTLSVALALRRAGAAAPAVS